MTWTRLFYVKSIQQAFKRVVPGKERAQLPITKRYQAQIKKQFRIAGVPWIYNLNETTVNPRDRRPKPQKKILEKQIRIEKIQKALKENENKQIEYRQQRLNSRRLRGSDELIARGLPSWIKADLNQIPEYMLKGRRGGGSGGEDDQ